MTNVKGSFLWCTSNTTRFVRSHLKDVWTGKMHRQFVSPGRLSQAFWVTKCLLSRCPFPGRQSCLSASWNPQRSYTLAQNSRFRKLDSEQSRLDAWTHLQVLQLTQAGQRQGCSGNNLIQQSLSHVDSFLNFAIGFSVWPWAKTSFLSALVFISKTEMMATLSKAVEKMHSQY